MSFDARDRRLLIQRLEDGFALGVDGGDFLITLFLQILLVESGMTFIHSAGVVDSRDRALLIAGPGGVGKTAIVTELVKTDQWRLLGDDLVIIGRDGRCLSFPRSFVLKPYHRGLFPGVEIPNKRSWRPRMVSALRTNLPFMGLLKWILTRVGVKQRVVDRLPQESETASVPVEKIFGTSAIAKTGRSSELVYVSRWGGRDYKWSSLDKAEVVNRLSATIHHEWSGALRTLMGLGASDFLDVTKYFEKVHEIAASSIEVQRVPHLLVPNDADPQTLVHEFKNGLGRLPREENRLPGR